MGQPAWYNTNLNRAYPFVTGSTHQPITGPLTLRNLPNTVIVDAGFVLGPESGFDAAQHSVFLQAIRRVGGTFYLDFGSDAAALAGNLLTFTRSVGDDRYTLEFLDSEPGSPSLSDASASAGANCRDPLWWGYLVTGDLADLASFLSGDGVVLRDDDDTTLEPALLQNLAGSYITAVHLANADRVRAEAADSCDELVWSFPTGGIFVSARCLQGELLVKEGFNVQVRQSTLDNALILGAAPGAGAGQPCDEVPVFPGETPPSGGTTLSGASSCNGTVRTLGGAGNRLLELIGGRGVQVTSSPAEHKITIDVDMSRLARCEGVSVT